MTVCKLALWVQGSQTPGWLHRSATIQPKQLKQMATIMMGRRNGRLILVLMLSLALLRSARGKEPWEEMPAEIVPETVLKPPPWLAPYLNPKAEGLHNNLTALASTVAKDGWVTIFTYNWGVRDFFLNCGWSLGLVVCWCQHACMRTAAVPCHHPLLLWAQWHRPDVSSVCPGALIRPVGHLSEQRNTNHQGPACSLHPAACIHPCAGLYSYLHFGDARHFVVAAAGDPVLQDCSDMKLPCYNATNQFLFVANRMEHGLDMLALAGQKKFHNFGERACCGAGMRRVQLGCTITVGKGHEQASGMGHMRLMCELRGTCALGAARQARSMQAHLHSPHLIAVLQVHGSWASCAGFASRWPWSS